MRSISRGDVFYISNPNATGSEQRGDRPAIVVSNDKANRYSSVLQVVFLTRRHKTNLPTHIPVLSFGPTSTALCEQITTVDVSRIKNYLCTITPANFPKSNGLFLLPLDSGIFPSQRTGNCSIDRHSFARILRQAQRDLGLPYRLGTHSMRKTFAYHVLMDNQQTPEVLAYLKKLFNHRDSATTLRYIGLEQKREQQFYKLAPFLQNNHPKALFSSPNNL